jgi:hypothetical protein
MFRAAAAKAVATDAASKVGYPMLWRQAALAVELCQRAAELAGPALPGSYRPASQVRTALPPTAGRWRRRT